MTHRTLILAFAIGLSLRIACHAADVPIRSFEVRLGTLEIKADSHKRFVFRWGSEEDFFSMSILDRAGIDFPGLPDLKEVGFRTKAGKAYEYGNVPKDIFIKRFAIDHPDEVGHALIFEGITGDRLEIKLTGKTQVYRVTLKLADRDVTLWSNVPEQRQ